jgi:predicted amidohydrolase YtcJ
MQPSQPVGTTQAVSTNATPDAAALAALLYQTNELGQPIRTAPLNSTALPVVLAGQLTLDPADFIIYNAKVLTLDSNFAIAQAIAIRSNIVMGVGKTKDMAVYQGPLTRAIDARGRVVMPGLYDGYVQSYDAAVSELNGALPVIDSIAGAQEYIRRQSTNRPGSWIVLRDLYPTRLKEGRLPNKAELDAASTNNPVVWNVGSMAIVNSKALEVSHIVKESTDPKGGLIVRDHKFKPTGVLKNTAIGMLRMPPPPPAATAKQRREALKTLYALYNQYGITSIAEQNATTNAIDVFRNLAASNELTVRINVSRNIDPGTNDLDGAIALLESMTNAPTNKIAYGPTGAGDDWVRIGALNFYLDGDVTMANAFLRTPYGIGPTYDITEPAYRSVLKPEPHVMSDLCWEATTRGWQLSAYCSGDAALDFALNCYERIQFHTNVQDLRFAITHNDFQASQDWTRCTNLNVVANLQPTCLNQDGASLAKTLGDQRLTWFMPIKSWIGSGLVVGAGSDHRAGTNSFDSISPWNPWLGVWITVTRETESGTVLNPEERLSREQAIRLYTSNNAWNHFEDRKKGSLELGKYADLIMLDTDILECPVDDIRATGVLLTMVNGKVVWESKNNWTISSASSYRAPEPQ